MSCILALESSCDETAAAVVDASLRVRCDIVASQHDLHAEYGGVVPEIASRAHLERFLPVIRAALSESGLSLNDVSAVAVGIRPGLIGSLLVGTSAAKALAWSLDVPFYGVDHVAAHLFAGLLRESSAQECSVADLSAADFPALGLVVSGGHTSLFSMNSASECLLIGRTIDDAVGEALDKAAAMLGLPHPGGPNLERCALHGDASVLRFTTPVLPNSLDFSLSGLKTKLLYAVRGVPQGRGSNSTFAHSSHDLTATRRADLAASFQHAAVKQVMHRLTHAASLTHPRTLFVGGGVLANQVLRRELTAWSLEHAVRLIVPAPRHCVDNAAMIAGYAQLRRQTDEVGDDLSMPAEPVSTFARGTTSKRTVKP